jgi:sugar diacid utilization regulator
VISVPRTEPVAVDMPPSSRLTEASGRPAAEAAAPDPVELLRHAADPAEALRVLVAGLVARTGGEAVLVEFRGSAARPETVVLAGDARDADSLVHHDAVRSARLDPARTAAFRHAGRACHAVGVGPASAPAVLLLTHAFGLTAEARAAAESTAWLADLYRRAHRAAAAEERLVTTRTRLRESLFGLLCAGDAAAARQIAAVLGRTLPDPLRVCVLEGLPTRLRERHRGRPEILGDHIWAFRASVQRDAVVLLAPADDHGASADLAAGLAAGTGCLVGWSEAVPLKATGIGYEQALHALYAARAHTDPDGRFESRSRLAYVLGAEAHTWAQALLHPLLAYEPPRRTAADSAELLHTTRVWLRLQHHAPRNLGLHRNTVRERLRLVSELLGADFNRVAEQSIVSLALKILDRGAGDSGARAAGRGADRDGVGIGAVAAVTGARTDASVAPSLAALLDSAEAVAWARSQLRPLSDEPSDVGLRTVRVWLAYDACVVPAAAALGLSVSATRKRLVRVSRDLGRSLLELPGARHDLWLALLVRDRAAARARGSAADAPPVPALSGPGTERVGWEVPGAPGCPSRVGDFPVSVRGGAGRPAHVCEQEPP